MNLSENFLPKRSSQKVLLVVTLLVVMVCGYFLLVLKVGRPEVPLKTREYNSTEIQTESSPSTRFSETALEKTTQSYIPFRVPKDMVSINSENGTATLSGVFSGWGHLGDSLQLILSSSSAPYEVWIPIVPPGRWSNIGEDYELSWTLKGEQYEFFSKSWEERNFVFEEGTRIEVICDLNLSAPEKSLWFPGSVAIH